MKKLILKLMRLYLRFIMVLEEIKPGRMQKGVYQILWERAANSSADLIEKQLNTAMLMRTNHRLWDKALDEADPDGLFLELGVFQGRSIRYFASKLPNTKFFGFDSFEGLQEDWAGTEDRKGHFDVGGKLPSAPANCSFVKGWIKDTLPSFLAEANKSVSFVHIDVDTYQSTVECLSALHGYLVSGSVIVFDEYHGVPGWQFGEFKAWEEYCSKHDISFDYLAFSRETAAVQIRALKK